MDSIAVIGLIGIKSNQIDSLNKRIKDVVLRLKGKVVFPVSPWESIT